LAGPVKITAFAGFFIAAFLYTCAFIWSARSNLFRQGRRLLLAALTIALSLAATLAWSRYADYFMQQNPLASMLRVSNIPSWYFGELSDRWSKDLWGWAIRVRDLPEALGNAWIVPFIGIVVLATRRRPFFLALGLILSYLSVYMFFPKLHIANSYYQVENVIFLCAAVVTIIEGLLQNGHAVAAYLTLGITIVSQIFGLYSGTYGPLLFDDLHRHPYYLAGLTVKESTSPDSVVVGFGMGWGADVPFYAERLGIIMPNWVPASTGREILFRGRARWLGGRKVGAVVDCSVFEIQRIAPSLVPLRDELVRELGGTTIDRKGSLVGANVDQPECKITIPKQ
jgi:hypothetical protein